MSTDTSTAEATAVSPREAAAGFVWKDFGRFVEVQPVRTGWLVLWGRYEEAGRRKTLAGNRTYADLAGARRRLADAVLELTRKPALAAEALARFDRHPFPPHDPAPVPEPL
jgi:hypothetical protein